LVVGLISVISFDLLIYIVPYTEHNIIRLQYVIFDR